MGANPGSLRDGAIGWFERARDNRLTTVTFPDLQLAVEWAATERRIAINARYDFAAARIALEQVVGGPLDGGTPLP